MNDLKKIAIGRQYNEWNGFQPWCKRVWIDAVKMKVRGERCWEIGRHKSLAMFLFI